MRPDSGGMPRWMIKVGWFPRLIYDCKKKEIPQESIPYVGYFSISLFALYLLACQVSLRYDVLP
tara:strand:+ start:1494 stop:1685 length:192 start_codon:yes stop_codon:yes gene_type:complete